MITKRDKIISYKTNPWTMLECTVLCRYRAYRAECNHEHIQCHLWESFRTTTIVGVTKWEYQRM